MIIYTVRRIIDLVFTARGGKQSGSTDKSRKRSRPAAVSIPPQQGLYVDHRALILVLVYIIE